MRAVAALSLGIACGIFALVAGMGLTGSWLAAGLLGAAAAGGMALWMHRRPFVPLDETACTRPLLAVSAAITLVALVLLARLAVFMMDPSRVAFAHIPTSRWEVEHSCLTAYYVAAGAATTRPDIYDDTLYSVPGVDPGKPREALRMGPFRIDVFEYPPPFLLLPRALMRITPDFTSLRMLWFGLSGFVILGGMLAVARWLGPAAGTRALLLSPLVWMALPTIGTLQKGNIQLMVIAASILAMMLFERGHAAPGGTLLAFVTVSKLYPGLLVIYLLARRRWAAVGWTAAMGMVFAAVTVADIGWAPYGQFLDHLPGLLSGEAFPAFRNPAGRAINLSIPGLVFKVGLFGVPGMSFPAAKALGWIYTMVAVAAVWYAGRRAGVVKALPMVWMSILILATLRSPFLPQAYGIFPPLWLLTLLAATIAPTIRTLSFMLLAWVALVIEFPVDWPMDPRVRALISVMPQTVTIALAVLGLRRAIPEGTAP
ncbi:MAG: glycosyltransferase family 87 protein [Candidatus Polarisedimenticolia bacterium]